MTRSPDDLLRELHSKLLQTLIDRLNNGEEVKAADLEVARKFLADNGIDADARRDEGLQTLGRAITHNLPFLEGSH